MIGLPGGFTQSCGRFTWPCVIGALALLAGCAAGPGAAPGQNQQRSENVEQVNSARIHTELAANYYSRRQYDVALEELGLSLNALPGYGPAYNMLGLVYMDLKDDAKARQSFDRALQIDPNDSDTNNNYGWFLCQRGDAAQSLAYFSVAQRNPLYTTPEKSLLNAGICARKANEAGRAEDYFRQVLALQPNQPTALYNLAEMNFARGTLPESRAYLSRYMRATDPSAEALWLGVRTERRLNDRGAAASYAAQLCRRYPDSRECEAVKSGVER